MKWINTTDLSIWASTREAQGLLPHVIRMLIQASCEPMNIRFPSGDAIWVPGYDGVLEVEEGALYIPEGKSCWECGCDSNPKNKANEDYKKRNASPLGVDQKEVEFVFVTPRVFAGKNEWCEEKNKEGIWKTVRCVDAVDLENWLELNPGVAVWLAEKMDIFTEGAVAADHFYSEWKSISDPPININIVLSGRAEAQSKVEEWLSCDPSTIFVQAPTKDESMLFLIATAVQQTPDKLQNFFSRAVIVKSEAALQRLCLCKNRLIFIIDFECNGSAFSHTKTKGHSIYIPLDPTNTINDKRLTLPRLNADGFIKALEKSGYTHDEAWTLNRETGRSLSALTRRLAPASRQPEWAKSPQAEEMIPIMLAEKWNESKEGDKRIISELAEGDYSLIERLCNRTMLLPESPLCKIADHIRLLSPVDAWCAISPCMVQSDFDKFKRIFLEVMGKRDPSLDLEPDKRCYANIYHKESDFSQNLKIGLCQTLILIATRGRSLCLSEPQSWVDSVVRELLHDASADRWLSLSGFMILIAEASPCQYIEAINHSLSKEKPEIAALFEDTTGTMFSRCYYADVLWGLELLAWDPNHLRDVSLILAKLSHLKTNSHFSNSPAGSLRDIFLLWSPQTSADFGMRQSVIEMLIDQEPEVAWPLLLELIPNSMGFQTPNLKPRWRELNATETVLTHRDIFEHSMEIIDLLLIHVSVDCHRWSELIEKAFRFPACLEKVITVLEDRVNKLSDADHILADQIRKTVSFHRLHNKADWAAEGNLLDRLETIHNALIPDEIFEKHYWLFNDHRPSFLDVIPFKKGDNSRHKAQEIRIAEERRKAVDLIYGTKGIQGVIDFACNVELPLYAGHSLSEIAITLKEEQLLLNGLTDRNDKFRNLTRGYLRLKSWNDQDWLTDKLQYLKTVSWKSEKNAEFLLDLRENMDLYKEVETYPKEIQTYYWNKSLGISPQDDKDTCEYVVRKLLECNRTEDAIRATEDCRECASTKLIYDVLFYSLEHPPNTNHSGYLHGYEIQELFNELNTREDIQKENLIQLEWYYLDYLTGGAAEKTPDNLCKELASKPEFFAEIIRYGFRSANENQSEESEVNQKKQFLARNAWTLFRAWNITPGTDLKTGKVDLIKLRDWIHKAREECLKTGHLGPCDSHVGQILAKAPFPTKEDEIWPPEYVCEIIESYDGERMTQSFMTQIRNNRGVVTRACFEGGVQERDLIKKYSDWADALAICYPRTSKCLKVIADSYKKEAKWVDDEAELRSFEG